MTQLKDALITRVARLRKALRHMIAKKGQQETAVGTAVNRPAASSSAQTWSRRGLLGALAVTGTSTAVFAMTDDDQRQTLKDALGGFFQDHYQRMNKTEVEATIARLERRYKKKYGSDVQIGTEAAIPGVLYGYALDLGRCKGYRDCVKACVKENNQSRDSEIQYIRVLEIDKNTMDLEQANHYYDPDFVPKPGKVYLPVQCQQCENPPCVSACPVEATWKEPDGIVVIDYNWCIGCRYCAAACPYWARKFNFSEPGLPAAEVNTNTHYLSNRPREKGVMEKCTFCLQRTRKGQQPACQEACPTGARVFGNLLDPNSEIRYILEHKHVFRLKEELNTEPKFWYYTS